MPILQGRPQPSSRLSGVLGPLDPLPLRPQRVLVAGRSGSGKTTTAARIGEVLDLPHVELDELHHGPGWTPRPEFLDDVRVLADFEGWVTEFQYADARPILLARADLLVWLDLSFAVSMGRLVRRTLKRRVRRETLWNGNQEPPLHTLLTDPQHILRYTWEHRKEHDRRVPDAAGGRPELPVVRLTRADHVDRWLERLNAVSPR